MLLLRGWGAPPSLGDCSTSTATTSANGAACHTRSQQWRREAPRTVSGPAALAAREHPCATCQPCGRRRARTTLHAHCHAQTTLQVPARRRRPLASQRAGRPAPPTATCGRVRCAQPRSTTAATALQMRACCACRCARSWTPTPCSTCSGALRAQILSALRSVHAHTHAHPHAHTRTHTRMHTHVPQVRAQPERPVLRGQGHWRGQLWRRARVRGNVHGPAARSEDHP